MNEKINEFAEGLFRFVFEFLILGFFKLVGASALWCWKLGRQPFREIWQADWNGRRGLLIVLLLAMGGICLYLMQKF